MDATSFTYYCRRNPDKHLEVTFRKRAEIELLLELHSPATRKGTDSASALREEVAPMTTDVAASGKIS